jgi:hypothetical protein
MAHLASEELSDVGAWLAFSEGDAQLLALAHTDAQHPEPGVTVFWPARQDGERFAAFFEGALPRVREEHGQRQVDRRQLFRADGAVSAPPPGRAQPYDQFYFLRFEHLQTEPAGTEHPVLVVWCNLEAGRQATVASDAAGVLLQPRHLPGLQAPLAALIANTSTEQPALYSIVAMLEELGSYLTGGAAPLAATA